MDWKKSTDLVDFRDFPANATGSSVSVNGLGDIEFDPADAAEFFRVEGE